MQLSLLDVVMMHGLIMLNSGNSSSRFTIGQGKEENLSVVDLIACASEL